MSEGDKDRLLVELEMQRTRAEAEIRAMETLQKELEASRNRFASLYNNAPIGYITFDARTYIRDLNLTAASLLGRLREQLLHTPFGLVVAPADVELFTDHMTRCRQSGEERVVSRLRLRKKGGEFVPVQLVTTPLPNQVQRSYQTAIVDLTETEKQEIALQESRALAEGVVQTVREPLVVLDANLRVVSVNNAFTQVFKTSTKIAKGMFLEVFLNLWGKGKRLQNELERVILTNTPLDDFPLDVSWQKLGKRSFLLSARRLQQKEPSEPLLLVALQDITVRKQAEERLKKSERLLAEAQRLAHLGSWEWDVAANKVTWSDELYRIFGLEPGNFAGTVEGYLERVHPDDRKKVEDVVRAALQERNSFNHVSRIVRSDGTLRVLQSSGYVVADRSGQAVKLLGACLDVTELKKSEESLRQLNEQLEERVKVRTHALEESNQQMESFCYSIAHDLRAPLRAIKGFGQVLAEDYGAKIGDEGQDYIHRMTTAAGRMDQLIHDLLEYGRLNTVDLAIEDVDADEVLSGILMDRREAIQEKHATIIRKTTLPRVRGHQLALEVALANLIDNALKFVEPGVPPVIEVWAEKMGRAQDDASSRNNSENTVQGTDSSGTSTSGQRHAVTTRIWIQDNGIGIAPEHQERIFEVFQRLHLNETFPGTGIGLAIVRRGIERIGGHVGVESELGKGSRFWLELPIARSSH